MIASKLHRGEPPSSNFKDFISFLRNEDRSQLIPLRSTWYYLNALDSNCVEVYRVDPEQTFMGNALSPACLAVLDDPLVGTGRVITG